MTTPDTLRALRDAIQALDLESRVDGLHDENDQLRARIDAVRALHRTQPGTSMCAECSAPIPCPTVQDLDAEVTE